MQLQWKASFSASCLHAACCVEEGLPAADADLAAALLPAVNGLREEMVASALPCARALPLLTGLAAEYDNNRQLAQMAMTRLIGATSPHNASIERLAGCVADLEATMLRRQHNLAGELAVRGRPIREQWEARGPGLLRSMRRLADEDFIAPAGEVVLVHPFVGGHGRAHLQLNRVTLEAVLANPYAALPETLRLGWLLVQLNAELPRFGEAIPQHRLPRVAALACLPLVLAAAESVEWAVMDLDTISSALRCWHFPQDLSPDVATQLLSWWNTFAEGEARWPVALAALDAMLPG